MKKNIFFFVLILSSLFACQSTEQKLASETNAFFDLENYFEKESAQWRQHKGFKKSTQINGEKESQTFDTLDFTKEFAMFANADINRIAWLDQYQVDSTLAEDGSLSTITYQALKADLQTQKVTIAFTAAQPSFIAINRLMENALMNSSMLLEYHAGKSYRIQSNQKLRISEAREMIVEVEMEP